MTYLLQFSPSLSPSDIMASTTQDLCAPVSITMNHTHHVHQASMARLRTYLASDILASLPTML
jgi:hypothetical protein